MEDWIWIGEAVEQTGLTVEALMESFQRVGVPVEIRPYGKAGMKLAYVNVVAFSLWKTLASWRAETRYRVTAVPICPPAPAP